MVGAERAMADTEASYNGLLDESKAKYKAETDWKAQEETKQKTKALTATHSKNLRK